MQLDNKVSFYLAIVSLWYNTILLVSVSLYMVASFVSSKLSSSGLYLAKDLYALVWAFIRVSSRLGVHELRPLSLTGPENKWCCHTG